MRFNVHCPIQEAVERRGDWLGTWEQTTWPSREFSVVLETGEEFRGSILKRLACPYCGKRLVIRARVLKSPEAIWSVYIAAVKLFLAPEERGDLVDHHFYAPPGYPCDQLSFKPSGEICGGGLVQGTAYHCQVHFHPDHPELFNESGKPHKAPDLTYIADLSDEELAIMLFAFPSRTIELLGEIKDGWGRLKACMKGLKRRPEHHEWRPAWRDIDPVPGYSETWREITSAVSRRGDLGQVTGIIGPKVKVYGLVFVVCAAVVALSLGTLGLLLVTGYGGPLFERDSGLLAAAVFLPLLFMLGVLSAVFGYRKMLWTFRKELRRFLFCFYVGAVLLTISIAFLVGCILLHR